MSVLRLDLPEAPGAGRLGRHVVHDERSRAYPVRTAGVDLRSVRWYRWAPILDQGSLGSCTGNAMVGALATDPVFPTIPAGTQLDQVLAVQLYALATGLDAVRGLYPPTDTGSSGLAVCKAAKARGLIGSYRWAFGLDQALRAVAQGPALFGLTWWAGFDHPDHQGVVRIEAGDVQRGGHEVLADELDVERRLVGFANSWGPWWGLAGRFYVSWDDLGELLEDRGDVVVPAPLGVRDRRSCWSRLTDWLRREARGS